MTGPTPRAPGGDDVGRLVRTLKDGYWDRTEVVQLADGSLGSARARGRRAAGPWGLAALRKEIEYLSTLPPRARAVFPPLLAAWDDPSADPPRVGYEVPFYADHLDAGGSRERALAQPEITLVSRCAGGGTARTGARAGARGNRAALPYTWSPWWITRSARWRRIRISAVIRAESIRFNGEPQAGPRVAFARAAPTARSSPPRRRTAGAAARGFASRDVLWRQQTAPSRQSARSSC